MSTVTNFKLSLQRQMGAGWVQGVVMVMVAVVLFQAVRVGAPSRDQIYWWFSGPNSICR